MGDNGLEESQFTGGVFEVFEEIDGFGGCLRPWKASRYNAQFPGCLIECQFEEERLWEPFFHSGADFGAKGGKIMGVDEGRGVEAEDGFYAVHRRLPLLESGQGDLEEDHLVLECPEVWGRQDDGAFGEGMIGLFGPGADDEILGETGEAHAKRVINPSAQFSDRQWLAGFARLELGKVLSPVVTLFETIFVHGAKPKGIGDLPG